LILRPASDNAQYIRPAIVNRFPTSGLDVLIRTNLGSIMFSVAVGVEVVLGGTCSRWHFSEWNLPWLSGDCPRWQLS